MNLREAIVERRTKAKELKAKKNRKSKKLVNPSVYPQKPWFYQSIPSKRGRLSRKPSTTINSRISGTRLTTSRTSTTETSRVNTLKARKQCSRSTRMASKVNKVKQVLCTPLTRIVRRSW